eukprot:6142677-Lingulodinium_polyedra.AAC.1
MRLGTCRCSMARSPSPRAIVRATAKGALLLALSSFSSGPGASFMTSAGVFSKRTDGQVPWTRL